MGLGHEYKKEVSNENGYHLVINAMNIECFWVTICYSEDEKLVKMEVSKTGDRIVANSLSVELLNKFKTVWEDCSERFNYLMLVEGLDFSYSGLFESPMDKYLCDVFVRNHICSFI
jgi:hypothetical protein